MAVAGRLLPQQGEGEGAEPERTARVEQAAVAGSGTERGEAPLPGRIVDASVGGQRFHVALQFFISHVVEVRIIVGVVVRPNVGDGAPALDRIPRRTMLPIPRIIQGLAANVERLVQGPFLAVRFDVRLPHPLVPGRVPNLLHRPPVLGLRQGRGERRRLTGRLNLGAGDPLGPAHPPDVTTLALPGQELPDHPLLLEQPFIRDGQQTRLHVAERGLGHVLDQVDGAGHVPGERVPPRRGYDDRRHLGGVDSGEHGRVLVQQFLNRRGPVDAVRPLQRSRGRRVGAAVLAGRQGDELRADRRADPRPNEPVEQGVSRTERPGRRGQYVVVRLGRGPRRGEPPADALLERLHHLRRRVRDDLGRRDRERHRLLLLVQRGDRPRVEAPRLRHLGPVRRVESQVLGEVREQ